MLQKVETEKLIKSQIDRMFDDYINYMVEEFLGGNFDYLLLEDKRKNENWYNVNESEIIRLVEGDIWYPEVLSLERDLFHSLQVMDECEIDITEEYKMLTDDEKNFVKKEFTVYEYNDQVLCYDTRILFFYWVVPDFFNTEKDEIE